MATSEETKQFGCIAAGEPCFVTDVKEGETKYWCRCGLSKNQPWCDGSHKGTGVTPLKWTADGTNSVNGGYAICACKQTKNPPFCDGSHQTAKEDIAERVKNCAKKDGHQKDCSLCAGCGGTPELF